MQTLVAKTNEAIKERGLEYSPKLFNSIYNELKSTPAIWKQELERQHKMLQVKENHTPSRYTAYGMNKRPY
tara:strand:- start:267 stop:479 length:213 start_codon:yes stop_codon:yes gene_type:complete